MQQPEDTTRAVGEALAPLSRRRFLRAGLLATAAVAAAAAGGFALLRRSPRDALPLPVGIAHLSSAHYQLFNRLAAVLLPTAGTSLFPVGQVPVAANVDALLGALEPAVREQLALGLALFDNAAVLGHGCRFVDLDDATARDYVEGWVNAGLLPKRAIGFAVTKLTHSAYWMDARTWPALDYDGPVTRKWGLAARGNQPEPA